MLIKTRAVVLRTIKYGESQLIADMFTATNGRLSFIIRIPKTGRARVKRQLFQPLSVLDIVTDLRPNTAMHRIKDVTVAFPLTSLQQDFRKTTIAIFVAEFLLYATRSEQQNEPLFRYIEDSIRWIDTAGSAFANFHIVFMTHLTMFVGFYPNMDDSRPGAFFDLRSGCFTPAPPPHPDYLRPSEASKIALLMRMNYVTMHLVRLTREERNRCVELVMRYYRLHVPNFPELKSLAVLQEVFG